MKKSWFILLFLTLSFFSFHSSYALSYEEFQQKFQIINTDYPGLINSSEGKDIIVFMGATGSGKSTTLNFLNDIPMIKNAIYKNFINSDNPNSFFVSGGGSSQTLIPKYINHNNTDVFMYDFAGWEDNRGAIDNLIGAAFIKKIIESAKTCKIVFVTSEPDIESTRAESFKKFLLTAQKVFKSHDLKTISRLIVTKADIIASEAKWDYISQKLEGDITDLALFGIWKAPHVLPFSKAVIDETEKVNILESIGLLDQKEVKDIDISHIYNGNIQKELGDLFTFEFKGVAEAFFNNFNQLPVTNNVQVNQAQEYLNNLKNLILNKIEQSKVVELFKPLSTNVYQDKKQIVIDQVNQFVSLKTDFLKSKKQAIEDLWLSDPNNWPKEIKTITRKRETDGGVYIVPRRTRDGSLFHGPTWENEHYRRTLLITDTIEQTIATHPKTNIQKVISEKTVHTDTKTSDVSLGFK